MSIFEEISCLDVPLAEKLSAYTDHLRDHNSNISEVYSSLVDRLQAANSSSSAVAVGSILPAFLLPDEKGHLVRSAKLLSEGQLVVSFNRGHWCSYCRLELLALAGIYRDIKKCGGSIISIVPESALSTKKFRSEPDQPFQILTMAMPFRAA